MNETFSTSLLSTIIQLLSDHNKLSIQNVSVHVRAAAAEMDLKRFIDLFHTPVHSQM